MGIARRLLLRLTNAASNSARCFSSCAAVMRRPGAYSPDESDCSEEKSAVYRRALKIQRPTTVELRNILCNHVSLIGTIEKPLKPCDSEKLGFRTSLEVKASPGAYPDFWILLMFWDELAEMSVQYLKPHDFVYVSGRLESYREKIESRKSKYRYQVVVSEVNFVVPPSLRPANQDFMNQEPKFSVEDMKQRRRDRLHLWQIFFASPLEWWDNRSQKMNPRAPDFVHRDTREVLWLSHNDPPWVRQQLHLYDSRSGKQNPGLRNATSHLSALFYEDGRGS